MSIHVLSIHGITKAWQNRYKRSPFYYHVIMVIQEVQNHSNNFEHLNILDVGLIINSLSQKSQNMIMTTCIHRSILSPFTIRKRGATTVYVIECNTFLMYLS